MTDLFLRERTRISLFTKLLLYVSPSTPNTGMCIRLCTIPAQRLGSDRMLGDNLWTLFESVTVCANFAFLLFFSAV